MFSVILNRMGSPVQWNRVELSAALAAVFTDVLTMSYRS